MLVVAVTALDLVSWPSSLTRRLVEEMVAEILDGELYLSPRPARPHANVASNLGIILGPPFKSSSGSRRGGSGFLAESFAGEKRVRAEPFEALELELVLVWSE